VKNLTNWNLLATVPLSHLKTIGFGALKGKSDINPQWRYKAMTEVYGPCGEGWSHRLVSSQVIDGANDEKLVFIEVAVTVKGGGEFTGMGGDKITARNGNGTADKPYKWANNDEAFKMAYTDALGTALKYVGVASEIYEGNYDGSKYAQPVDATSLSAQERYEDSIMDLMPSVKAIKDGIASSDLSTANEAWKELTDTEKQLLWVAPANGGVFTTQERAIMKTPEFREAQ
jgi:hypothetical protein